MDIFFNDRWAGFDDGIYAGARLLEIIDESKDEDIFEDIPNIFLPLKLILQFQIAKNFKLLKISREKLIS